MRTKIFCKLVQQFQLSLSLHIQQRSYDIKIINKYKMAFSPSRKMHTAYLIRKQSYTQNRQQNINQANLSQYSPSIRSPKLNEESEYTKLHNVGLVQELKTKLETVLKHNSHLLNENATLSEMVNNLKIELQLRSRREQAEAVKISAQYTTIIQQLRQSLQLKQAETVRLLDEISRLHDESYKIQILKNNEIKLLAQQHEKQMTIQIRNLKKSAEDGKQIQQLQIKKLRQSIQLKNFEYQALKSTSKSENDKIRSQLQQIRNQIKHFNQLKQMQIRQINEKYKQIVNTTTKQTQRQNNLVVSKLETKIRKLKQDVNNKNIEIEQATKKSVMNTEDHQLEIQNIATERQRLIQEINQLEISNKENLHKQKIKMRELSQLEIKNLENIAQNQRQCLKGEISKLLIVCSSKTDEIKKLYNNIIQIKDTHAAEKRDNDRLVQGLRKRIKVLEQDNLQQLELLKIKMAQLHQADVRGLEAYYENQVVILIKQIKELQQQRDADRTKIHNCLQENDLLRKNFQTQLTKYKAKIQDYKVKFAAAHLQYREQITSLGTKMELTSQTLLREAEQKQKGAQFFEAQKKKFHLLILGKDKQIASAHQTMNQLKQLHGQEVKQLREQISALREQLNSKTTELKELRKDLQQQFERKSQKIIEQRRESPNDILVKQNKQLRDKIQIIQKQIFQKVKQIQFLQRQNKSLQQQVGLRAGFLQTMQLESSAAIEDERSKLKILMNENQVAMKDYYESKLATKNRDISGLEAQLHEKENDIRQLIVKYNQLQKRLKELLDSQERLSQFEKKIVNLGLDQNLVKNMAQLFARYRK